MLALAISARDALLVCGPVIFQHGDAQCVKSFTSGLQTLVELAKKLDVLWADDCVLISSIFHAFI
jgi:hypothetical protein